MTNLIGAYAKTNGNPFRYVSQRVFLPKQDKKNFAFEFYES